MVRKNKGWRGVLVDRKHAAIFLAKNLKTVSCLHYFICTLQIMGISTYVLHEEAFGSRVEEGFISAKR